MAAFPSVEPLGRDSTVDDLIARAFADRPWTLAPDRAAVRLREGADPLPDLSLAVRRGDLLLGALLAWPVRLNDRPLTLIGPVAVEPAAQGTGVGVALMIAACASLTGPAVLVGDEGYYGRWGFTAAPTGRWRVEGAIERDRLLARPGGAALAVEGALSGEAAWQGRSAGP